MFIEVFAENLFGGRGGNTGGGKGDVADGLAGGVIGAAAARRNTIAGIGGCQEDEGRQKAWA